MTEFPLENWFDLLLSDAIFLYMLLHYMGA